MGIRLQARPASIETAADARRSIVDCFRYRIEPRRRLLAFIHETVGHLLRCHPWHPGSIDPIPPSKAQRAGAAFR